MYFKTARGMKQLFIISKESRAARIWDWHLYPSVDRVL